MVCSNFHSTRVCKLCLFLFAQFIVPYQANITSMADIQSLFKETIAEFMENGLEAELDEELGYSKYPIR